MKKFILFFLLLLSLTGCSRYTDVNSLGIVEVMMITKDEKIKEAISIVIPKKDENDYQVLESEGTSLGNAFLKLENQEVKKIYFEQTQILLLNQKIIEENGEELISFLLTHFKHPNWLVFLCKDCESILKKEKNHSFYENLVRKEHTRSGNTAITTFEDFSSYYLDKSLTAYLPTLIIKDKKIQLDSLMALTNQRQWKTFSKEEAKTFYLLKNRIPTLEENISINQKDYSLSLNHLTTNFSIKDNTVKIVIAGTYHLNDAISYSTKKIEDALQQKLTIKVMDFLSKEKKEDVDLLGLNHLFYLKEKSLEVAKEKQKKASYQIQFKLTKDGDKK